MIFLRLVNLNRLNATSVYATSLAEVKRIKRVSSLSGNKTIRF